MHTLYKFCASLPFLPQVPEQLLIGIVKGNPGVFQGDLYPYL